MDLRRSKLTIALENGKQVVINAANNDAAKKYVGSLNYDAKPYSKNWISHSALQKGAILNFTMSATPNKQRGVDKKDFPYSLSNEK